MAKKKTDDRTVVARNRKARHEYDLGETFEAGLELVGTEVKSLRQGHATISDAFITVEHDQAYLNGAHIPEYVYGHQFNHEPKRKRRLLLRKRQIEKIRGQLTERRMTAVPLEIYFRGGWAKLSFALGRGRKLYDKRHVEREKNAKRDLRDALR